jgi:uncharacterized membrane protein
MNKGLVIPKLSVNFSLEWLLLSAIAISIFLRIVNLGGREFWYDEVLSLLLSTGKKSAYHTPGDVPVVLAQYTSLLSLPVETSLRDFFLTLNQLIRSLLEENPIHHYFLLLSIFGCVFLAIVKLQCGV